MKWLLGLPVIAVIICFFGYLYSKQQALENKFQQLFAGKKFRLIDKKALYIAQQSDGYSHTRGMGYLVFTEEGLWFKRQLGNKEISIPCAAILKADKTNRLAGQSPGGDMLCVEFKAADGEVDAVAWKVGEPEKWIWGINSVIRPD